MYNLSHPFWKKRIKLELERKKKKKRGKLIKE
jgi:hypothetical protein